MIKKKKLSQVNCSGQLWAAVAAKPNHIEKNCKALKCDDSLDLKKKYFSTISDFGHFIALKRKIR
jgi:hypothetical protein